MARKLKTAKHIGPDLKGSPSEWVFAPWRCGRAPDDSIVSRREIFLPDEDRASALCADADERQRLAALLPSLTSFEGFVEGGRDASWRYQVGLERRLRPSPAEIKSRIGNIPARLIAVRKAMHLLDPWEWANLIAKAGEDPQEEMPWEFLEPRNSPLDHGHSRLNHAIAMMDALERWADAVVAEQSPETGRIRHDAERTAIDRLADLWLEQTGEEPRITTDKTLQEPGGGFLELCRGVIHPVCLAISQKKPPDLTGTAAAILAARKGEI